MDSALRSRLLAEPGIAAKVAKRVDWGDRPQAKGLPAISLETVNDPRPQHMGGLQQLRSTLVQIDVWSLDKLEARELRELVIAAVMPAGTVGDTCFRRSFIEAVRGSWELTEAGVTYRERIDAAVWHAPAV